MDRINSDGQRVRKKLETLNTSGARLSRKVSTNEGTTSPKYVMPKPQPVEGIAPSVAAGLVHGTIVMMSFANFAFIIFGQSEHAELRAALPVGISQQLLSAGLFLGLITFTGFFPFTMGGPTPPAALLVADVVAAVVQNVEDSEKKVPTAFLTMALISILMGLILLLISATKTSIYSLQLPYPVLCGFLGAVGCLLMRSAISILVGLKLKWVCVPVTPEQVELLDPVHCVTQLLLGLFVACLLLFGVPWVRPRVPKRLGVCVLPVMFVLPVVLFYVSAVSAGLGLSATSELRTTKPPWLNPLPEWTWAPKDLFANAYDAPRWDFGAIFSVGPLLRMLVAAVLCVVAAIINMAGIEANAPQPKSLNLDMEFRTLGAANCVVGLCMGHPGHHVAAFTLPMKKDGGTRRVAPWTASVLWLVVFATAAPLSAYIPRFFLGGCFLQVGFGLARTFLWDNRKLMDYVSMGIAWVTVIVAVFTDLNTAAGVGFLLATIHIMKVSMSSSVVRDVDRLDVKHAPVYRSAKDIEMLRLHGHRVMVLYLQGYLFWGTVDELTTAFHDIIDGTEDDPDTLFVDLRYVTGVELSVLNTLKKLHRLANNVGIKVTLCSMPRADIIGPQLLNMLKALPFCSAEPLTTLIERSEDKLLERWAHQTSDSESFASPGRVYTIAMVNKQADARQDAMKYWVRKVFAVWSKYVEQLKEEMHMRRTPKKQVILEALSSFTQSPYCLKWEMVDGELIVTQTFNPVWRCEQLVKAAMDKNQKVHTFATGSALVRVHADGEVDGFDEDKHAEQKDLEYEEEIETETLLKLKGNVASKAGLIKGAVIEASDDGGTWAGCDFLTRSPAKPASKPSTAEKAKPMSERQKAQLAEALADEELVMPNNSPDKKADDEANKPSTSSWAKEMESEVVIRSSVRNSTWQDVEASHSLLVRSFYAQKVVLLTDAFKVTCKDFPRKSLAAEYGVKSVLFIPSADGVYEMGCRDGMTSPYARDAHDGFAVLPEDPDMLLRNPKLVAKIFAAPKPPAQVASPEQTSLDLAAKNLSWSLIRGLATVGKLRQVSAESPVLEDPMHFVPKAEPAHDIFVILEGDFGTFHIHEDGASQLLLKSVPGAVIGADDVYAMRPRSVQLRCLSKHGKVIALTRNVVSRIEMCESPHIGPKEAKEFIDYMKREMSLNMSIMEYAFNDATLA